MSASERRSTDLTIEERRKLVAERTRLRPIEHADLPQVLKLLNAAFVGWGWRDASMSDEAWARYQLDHLRWKLHSPYADDVPSFVAEIDSVVVAIIMSIPRRMRVRGELLPVFGGGNHATAPAWQGLGVTQQLLQLPRLLGPEQGPVFVVANTTVPSKPGRGDELGVLPLGNPVLQLFKPLDARAFAADRRRRGQSRLPTLALALAIRAAALVQRLRWRPLRKPPAEVGRVSQIERFDERADTLAARAVEEFDLITDWSCEYLNWRFCDPRAGRFTATTVEADGELLGWVVTKVEGRSGYIAQMLALPGRADVAQVLLGTASRQLEDAGVVVIQCALPRRHPYADLFRRSGFLDSRREMRFLVSPPDIVFAGSERDPEWRDRLSFVLDADARAHVMLGDLDGI